MNKYFKAVALVCAATIVAACGQKDGKAEPVDYVNTYIGQVSLFLFIFEYLIPKI